MAFNSVILIRVTALYSLHTYKLNVIPKLIRSMIRLKRKDVQKGEQNWPAWSWCVFWVSGHNVLQSSNWLGCRWRKWKGSSPDIPCRFRVFVIGIVDYMLFRCFIQSYEMSEKLGEYLANISTSVTGICRHFL